jgi:predicted amidohydrolase
MTKIKISAVQYSYKPIKNFEEFASNVENLVNQANGSDFVVFPEAFTLELRYIIPNHEINKIPQYEGQYIELFKNLSKEKNQFIIAGSHLTRVNDKLYNIGHIFCPDGKIFKHSKTHLMPSEVKMGFTHGTSLEIFETEKAKIALGICYEMEFPEVARTLTLKGAEIIFTPSYTLGEHGFWRVRHSCQARAIENQIYVVHSCLVGIPLGIKMLEGWGRTSILCPCEEPWAPNGIIAEANTNEEMVITGEVDLKLLHKKRKRGVATTLNDRRPEIYKI